MKDMLSIIIALYNEEESLPYFYKELKKELEKLHQEHEIIFVDDGSIDNSLSSLKEIAKKDKNIKIYSFRRNQGKAEALSLGFQRAKGEYIVTLDADLQDVPSEIQKLLQKAKEGYGLVSGWRKNRKDSIRKVISSKIFNKLVNTLWGLNLHDYNCGLKVYTKEAARELNLYGGMHRFIPLLIFQKGFTVIEVPVEHEVRKFGKSKYGFSKIVKDLPDMFTMIFLTRYGNRPLHFFGLAGGLLFVVGIVILIYLSILRLEGASIGRRPLLFLGMLLVISGLQVFFTGFLADLLINVSQNKKTEPLLKYSTDK